MILTPNGSRMFLHPQLHRQQFPDQLQVPHHQLEQLQLVPRQRQRPALADSPAFATATLCGDAALDLDLDLDADLGSQSLSSSPLSTQSLLSQYSSLQHSPLSAFDPLPNLAGAEHEVPLFGLPHGPRAGITDTPAALFGTDPMPESWIPAQRSMIRSAARVPSHHRDSSLSSLASTTGPASPFSQSAANPRIAVTDSMGDFYAAGAADDFHHFQAAKPFPAMTHDSYYASFPAYNSAATVDASALAAAYPNIAPAPKSRINRGLQIPAAPEPLASRKSRPLSVASSVASDSPATPAAEPEEDARHPKSALHVVPKLDRTMTDVYSDELYSPNFTIPSASSGPVPVSPNHEIFAQRLQAANSQHLNAPQSPVSTVSRGMSPFRNGSPLAPVPMHDFSSALDHTQARWRGSRSSHQPSRMAADARSQNTASTIDTDGPQTISPKDALLEYHEPDGEANFPLFPPSDPNEFDAEQITKAAAAVQAQQQLIDSLADSLPLPDNLGMDPITTFNLLHGPLPLGLPMPQQYSFIGQPQQPQQKSGGIPGVDVGSPDSSRTTSAEVAASNSSLSGSPQRPESTLADSGTYTCTYHGCTQRFETPMLLQKHKREGHRQAHTLPGGARRPDASAAGIEASLFNSQAGPHRCDRINPSTGKPCAQVFSRPYDLTRHEDTIHNARKQKVRCDLCSEDKTFSRADALVRHYRVCHPDHEPQGKHRKKAAQSG